MNPAVSFVYNAGCCPHDEVMRKKKTLKLIQLLLSPCQLYCWLVVCKLLIFHETIVIGETNNKDRIRKWVCHQMYVNVVSPVQLPFPPLYFYCSTKRQTKTD